MITSYACSFILMQIKVIFIRMDLQLDSLWNRGTRELGNGLLFYSFSCFECLLISFCFFFVLFICLSFTCFHLRYLGLPQWFMWILLDRPDFQITVHSHWFESSRNHWRLQKDLHEMEEFCFFRRRSSSFSCQDRTSGLVPSASSGYDPFSFCGTFCSVWNPMGSQFGGDTFPYWQSYYSWC